MADKQYSNALIEQTSPYLLQHAHNPVDWHPWGDQALTLAIKANKPILLSIGYSACHWCHVMAHESFEDDTTAEIMNRHFINIKVDREERPDLDKIYQTAQQLLTRRGGGWPLTMFLHPVDNVPFFGGTYFPPVSRYGMPGFKDLLLRVADFYQQEQHNIREQNTSLLKAMEHMQESPATDKDRSLDSSVFTLFVQELSSHFDEKHGGFGSAPKFPHPANLESLLHYCVSTPDTENIHSRALQMALFTLEKMALGGIYDQLGGGFYRYSVDDSWLIPHFEKMLYDNGPLITLYAEAWKISGLNLYREVALESTAWLIREMQSPEGGYYSSVDADTDGVEGSFYVWTPAQVKSILKKDEYEVFAARFGLERTANFEGQWHLRICTTTEDIAEKLSITQDMVQTRIDEARKKLLVERNRRNWPAKDEKILTSWNALTIKGMAIAAIHLDNEELFCSAERALTFLHEHMWLNGKLLATFKDGNAHLDAYLDDYAFLIDAILALLSFRWSSNWLEFALELAEALMNNFYDQENGGFFFTSHQHEKLIQRRKGYMDDAMPAGNGIAAFALCKLGHLIGEQIYLNAAERTVQAVWSRINQFPSAHGAIVLAAGEICNPEQQLIIRGEEAQIGAWQARARELADIRTRIFTIPNTVDKLPGSLQQRSPADSTTAYLCRGFHCQAPITQLENISFKM